MRAINLIPADDRRGPRGAAPRSGNGVYVVLITLALLVVAAGAYVLAGNTVTDRQAELARINNEAAAAEARANQATDYTRFASLRQRREDTVRQLAASRFDWSHALHEVARVLPTNAWLTQLTASTTPGAAAGGDPLRSAIAVPALEIQGCTTSQASVARVMARLRLIDGVQRVSLSTADKGAKKPKADVSAAPTTGGGTSGDCRGISNHFPQFSVVVFYEAGTPVPTSPPGTAQTVASTTTPATTSSSSPSSGGTTP